MLIDHLRESGHRDRLEAQMVATGRVHIKCGLKSLPLNEGAKS